MMPPVKRTAYTVLAFAAVMVATCILNFLLQLAFIFFDLISRRDASSAYIIALWVVTGVFTTVLAAGLAEQFLGKENFSYKQTGFIFIVISAAAAAFAVVLLAAGHFRHNPQEFSLIFSNGYVFLSFFIGAGAMALVMRKLD